MTDERSRTLVSVPVKFIRAAQFPTISGRDRIVVEHLVTFASGFVEVESLSGFAVSGLNGTGTWHGGAGAGGRGWKRPDQQTGERTTNGEASVGPEENFRRGRNPNQNQNKKE